MQLALKLIASALQKQPKSQTLRVLKAVALQRSGKDEEGLQVRKQPTRPDVLLKLIASLPGSNNSVVTPVSRAPVGLRDSAP